MHEKPVYSDRKPIEYMLGFCMVPLIIRLDCLKVCYVARWLLSRHFPIFLIPHKADARFITSFYRLLSTVFFGQPSWDDLSLQAVGPPHFAPHQDFRSLALAQDFPLFAFSQNRLRFLVFRPADTAIPRDSLPARTE
jgi:hypothetical protein